MKIIYMVYNMIYVTILEWLNQVNKHIYYLTYFFMVRTFEIYSQFSNIWYIAINYSHHVIQ